MTGEGYGVIQLINEMDCHGAKAPRNDENDSRHPALDAGSINANVFCNDEVYKTNNIGYNSDIKHHYHFCKKFAFTLAEVFHPLRRSKRAAFTLAEVLITLGIIGVVAALTMPVLIANYQKQQTVTRLKYVYSLMSQAIESSQAEHGTPNEWDFGVNYNIQNTERMVKTYILPYIKYQYAGIENNSYLVRLSNGIILCFKIDGSGNIGNPPHLLYIRINLKNDKNAVKSLNSVYNPDTANTTLDYSKTDFILVFNKFRSNMSFYSYLGTSKDDLINSVYYGCKKDVPAHLRFNCGAMIMHDGWRIAPDYPW